MHGEIWEKSIAKFLFVLSEIMKTDSFEDSTRTSALEIVTTIAEERPSLLRKQVEQLRENLFPAMFRMIAKPELEEELQEWFD